MKIAIASDLHVDHYRYVYPPLNHEVDAVVFAGDIVEGSIGPEQLRHAYPNEKIIYVPGNHEYYNQEIKNCLEKIREKSLTHNITLLEPGVVMALGDVNIVGATLWTDFQFPPLDILGNKLNSVRWMNDYRLIRFGDRRLDPDDTEAIHTQHLQWLLSQANLADIVITHHLPDESSIQPRWAESPLNAAFASDVLKLFQNSRVKHWFHGHTHDFCDYTKYGIRVLCNPKGYRGENRDGWDFVILEL